MKQVDVLHAGARELAPVLVTEGFTFESTGAGHSSGGDYASGEFRRDDRRLEFHFRHSLGLVAYHVGSLTIDHEEYVRAVRGLDQVDEPNAYPGSHQDPAGQFRALRDDLQLFGGRFLRGSVEEFRQLRLWLDQHPKPAGFGALPR